LAAGADGVEVDLRLTADEVLAVCHDRDLRRIAPQPLAIEETPWEQLRVAAGPTPLARVEWVLAAAAGRPVVLELKPAPHRAAHVLVERLVGLHAAGLPMELTVSSFDWSLAAAFRAAAPAHLRVRTACSETRVPASAVLHHAVLGGHDQVHPHISDLLEDPDVVRCARPSASPSSRGRSTPARAAPVRRAGVHGVITDVPVKARLAVAGRRTAA
jgi:glycerophosphoryl diester phosphodiesterase